MAESKGNMRVVILTPYKRLFDLSGVTELYFPIENGIIGVLPGHAPMVTAVGIGILIYTQNDVSGFFKVSGGIAEVSVNSVTLLVDVAEDAAQIDLERAKSALERAENRLNTKTTDGELDTKRAEIARLKALSRIQASELYKNKQSQNSKTE